MIATLIRKELRESLWKTGIGFVILTGLGVATLLLYDMMKELLAQIPGEMGWIQNMLPRGFLDDYSLYVWGNWHAKNLYQFGTLIAVLLGMSTVAGEVSANTISFLLARPVSRKTVFFSKVVSGIMSLVVVVSLSTAAVLSAAKLLRDFPLDTGRLLVAAGITVLGLCLIYIIAVFFSTIFDEPVKAGGATLVTLLVMSVLNWFPATKKYSLFFYITGRTYFLQREFPVWPVAVMVLAAVLFLAAGMRLLEKKEL